MKVTINNLNDATEQEVFDTISAHLLRQRVKSMLHPNETCAYRSLKGLSCAVGCLIPQKDYKPEYERSGWLQLLAQYEYLPRRHSDFLSALQRIHDAYRPQIWSSKLRFFAKENQLVLNEEFIKLEEECNKFFNESNEGSYLS